MDGKLDLSERTCPKCGSSLSGEQVYFSYLGTIFQTSAVSSANSLTSLDLAIIPYIGSGILSIFLGSPIFNLFNGIIYFVPLALCVRWFWQYWFWVRSTEEEYLVALREMQNSLLLWFGANLAYWGFLLWYFWLIIAG
ncbi:MAG: hypothetical protein IT173_09930 [Acidobacteria bacterium]|nr:hypothetical protein [Acidobacteriota bacterium]